MNLFFFLLLFILWMLAAIVMMSFNCKGKKMISPKLGRSFVREGLLLVPISPHARDGDLFLQQQHAADHRASWAVAWPHTTDVM